MAKILVRRRPHSRKPYVRRGRLISGSRVSGSAYLTEDKGKKGKTRPEDRWYPRETMPREKLGWKKDMSFPQRKVVLAKADKKFGSVKTWQKMHGLANVTADQETKKLMRHDLDWFAKKHLDESERRRMTAAARRAR